MSSSFLLYLATELQEIGATLILAEFALLIVSSFSLHNFAARTEVGFPFHLLISSPCSHRKNHRSAYGVYPLSLAGGHLLLITGPLSCMDETWRKSSFSSFRSFWWLSSILSSNFHICSVKSLSTAKMGLCQCMESVFICLEPSCQNPLSRVPDSIH